MQKPLRIGLIGAAGRAILARHWHRAHTGESLVVAAADINPRALDEFRGWAGADAFTTSDYRELLARPDLDAVGVFTPDPLHEEHALAVLRARRHLYLEKPMCLSTEACDRVLEAWQASGQKFMMGFNMRFMPVFRKARELIHSGTIGQVKSVWVRHFVGAGSDFYFHDWHARRAGTHSLLLQKASHDFDMIHWLAGAYGARVAAFGGQDYFGGLMDNRLTCGGCPERESCPEAMPADHPRQQCAFRREIDVEDNHVVILRLANGVQAAYLQCHFTPEYLRNYVVIGTLGRLECNVERDELWVIHRPDQKAWQREPARVDYPRADTEGGHGGADPRIAQSFLDLVLRDVPAVSHPLAGRMSVAVGCAAVQSLRDGGMVDISPAPSGVPALSV